MPIDLNSTLHSWIKSYTKQPIKNMPTEPDKCDLLGFPGIQAEHTKEYSLGTKYIRKLWLVAENDRTLHPKFLDSVVIKFAEQVNKVVNEFAQKEDKRYKELCGDAFLEKEAVHILKDLKFGQEIWGENSGAKTRLKSNLQGQRPRWGVQTKSGYKSNDEDSIQLNLRHWMAARIQAKINAPCREKTSVPLATVKHTAQPSSELTSPSRSQQSKLIQEKGFSDAPKLTSLSKRHRNHSLPTVRGGSTADSSQSRSRENPGESSDSDKSFSFTSFLVTGSEAGFPQSAVNRSKRQRIDIPQGRSNTRSPQLSSETTSVVDIHVPSDKSADIVISDASSKNNNVDIDKDSLSGADRMKRKLQLDLTRFLDGEPDYTGILREVIPPAKQLYAISQHCKPHSDLEIEFSDFNRALIHWENLLERRTASSDVVRSFLEDLIQKLADQANFEDRVALFHHSGSRSHVEFPPQILTISLALFFEGLLGDAYMPFSFKVLVNKLRTVNQTLYDTI
ncbi:hypothetical protein J3E71DRAFT_377966 [Bipolaris maydis]|nr:hypothetical protein J3E71DRAFT_377966 [Bipolaris maydis]